MRRSMVLITLCAAFVVVLGGVAQAAPPRYAVQDLGEFWAAGLNDDGAVVGSAGSGAVLWSGGRLSPLPFVSATAISNTGLVVGTRASGQVALWRAGVLDPLGARADIDFPTDVNDHGWVTATDFPAGPFERALLWDGSGWTTLLAGEQASRATALNNAGDVVGSADFADDETLAHAVLWRDGTTIPLGTPGFGDPNDETATDINERGEIVGLYASDPSVRVGLVPFVWRGAGVEALPTPIELPDGAALAINERGVIAGAVAFDVESVAEATVWLHGQPILLNQAASVPGGFHLFRAIGVNERDQVLALGVVFPSEEVHSFLLSPAQRACVGRAPTIAGSPRADTLVGTRGADVIWGGGGADTIRGRGGADVICGNGGRDLIRGGSGRDLIAGGRGNDLVAGGAQADRLRGGGGGDRLAGRRGDDRLRGGFGADTLDGGTGTDTCNGGPGTDTVAACESVRELAARPRMRPRLGERGAPWSLDGLTLRLGR